MLAKVMNAQAPDCPPLYWSFRYGEVWSRAGLSGLAGVDYPDDQTGAVARQWADTFDLDPAEEHASRGTVEYSGEIHGLPVRVWAITDRDTWQRHCDKQAGR